MVCSTTTGSSMEPDTNFRGSCWTKTGSRSPSTEWRLGSHRKSWAVTWGSITVPGRMSAIRNMLQNTHAHVRCMARAYGHIFFIDIVIYCFLYVLITLDYLGCACHNSMSLWVIKFGTEKQVGDMWGPGLCQKSATCSKQDKWFEVH